MNNYFRTRQIVRFIHISVSQDGRVLLDDQTPTRCYQLVDDSDPSQPVFYTGISNPAYQVYIPIIY